MSEPVEFYAYLPPIQSAIMVSGDGDLMQVKFNIPLRESPEAFRLAAMTQAQLKVTVDIIEQENCTELNDETKKSPEGNGSEMGRRRIGQRRDK